MNSISRCFPQKVTIESAFCLSLNYSSLKITIVAFHVGIHDYNFTFTEGQQKKTPTSCTCMEIYTRKLRLVFFFLFLGHESMIFYHTEKQERQWKSPEKSLLQMNNQQLPWFNNFLPYFRKKGDVMREKWSHSFGAVKLSQLNS